MNARILAVSGVILSGAIYCLIAPIVAILSLSVCGQSPASDGLKLTGTVVAVNPRLVSGPDKKEKYEFDIDLLLQFRNDAKLPIIILNPERFYGTRRIAFLEDVSPVTNSELSSTSLTWKNPYQNLKYGPLDQLVQSIMWSYELKTPPSEYYFVTIRPDSVYEFRASFSVPNGFKVSKIPQGAQPPKLSVTPEFPALRVSFHFSLRNRPEHPNPLERAKEVYKKFGELVLDSNGDFSIRSQIIINRPPD